MSRKSGNETPEKRTGSSNTSAQTIFHRTMILLVIFGIAAFIPLVWKLYQLQIVQHDWLQSKATAQQTSDESVSASRGTIYDTSGKTLAVSATVYNVILSPKDINTVDDSDLEELLGEDYDETCTEAQIEAATEQIIQNRVELIATTLASILEDVDQSDIEERCESTTSMYSVVKKKVEAEDADEVREFIERYDLDAYIYLTNDSKRYYPYSSTAATILGFVNSSNEGAYGLEAYYDDELSATEGRIVTAKTSLGTDLLYNFAEYYDAEDGNDIYLTIDTTIQYYCEQILAEGIEKYNVLNGGWVIAMDPDTGAILGMASSPTYDANNPSEITDEQLLAELAELAEELAAQVESGEITEEESDTEYAEAEAEALQTQWTNRAVNTTYEPGSTFKSLVLAAALEEGVISEDTYSFYCSGSTTVDTWEISCSSTYGHGQETLADAVSNSCNLAFMNIGSSLGRETFWSYMKAFGLMETTGIEVAGESNSSWWSEEEFLESATGYVDLAVASFGQRFEVTPIQLITAVAATINGGYLYQPHLVQSIVDSDGNTILSNDATVIRQVVSEETSSAVALLLEGVVDGGGGSNAYQAGYRIGGKTGTAQTSNDDELIVSFVGFAPADDPEIIVLVAFDKPELVSGSTTEGTSGYRVYGGTMAAPLAGELIAEICDYLGVAKQYTADEEYLADSTMPSVIGMTEEEAAEEILSANLTYTVVGSGDSVTAQVPAAGVTLANSSEVVLYMGEEASSETVEMPDLTGMSKSEARSTLEKLGLYYKASGVSTSSGVTADGQSVTAGTSVQVGTVITVHFSDQSVSDSEGTIG